MFFFGGATEARLFFVGGILLLPVFFLAGLHSGLVCGLAIAVETRRRGRPGRLMRLLLATLGALIIHGRGGAEHPALVPLLVCHWGATSVCTFVARQLANRRKPTR